MIFGGNMLLLDLILIIVYVLNQYDILPYDNQITMLLYYVCKKFKIPRRIEMHPALTGLESFYINGLIHLLHRQYRLIESVIDWITKYRINQHGVNIVKILMEKNRFYRQIVFMLSIELNKRGIDNILEEVWRLWKNERKSEDISQENL